MPVKLGIGVTTYNRCRDLETCLFHVRKLTSHPFSLVVADDGSTDGTTEMCARQGIPCITGKNMGIAWNKNRALFFLDEILECDVIILLEDDCYPNQSGWDFSWVSAAQQWGHINFAGNWFCDRFLGGDGSLTNPFLSTSVSGQCVAFSRNALRVCGFLDPRFKGYGYEHSEHSSRLVRAGFGGEMRIGEGGKLVRHYYLLATDLTMLPTESYRNQESIASNREAWRKMKRDPVYRYPWRTDDEFRQFRREISEVSRCANLSWTQRSVIAAKWTGWRWLGKRTTG